ncbi:MAG: hypothetical protein WC155_08835 [Candidatus Cloacimonadales bacterium]
MSKKRITSLISTVIFFILVVLLNLYAPFIASQRSLMEIIIMGVIVSIIYYFVVYYLLGALGKRDKKKDEK